MAITRRAPSLSLAQQAHALRHVFPHAAVSMRGGTLTWVGVITPTPLSCDYTVRITYRMGGSPRVVVIDPTLQPDENGLLPHFYREGSICLYDAGQWDGSMFIADTILPWTSEWLAHYELWKRSGRWYGDDPADLEAATATPGVDRPRNRAERRRARRDEARRERNTTPQSGRNMAGAEAIAPRLMTGQNGGAVPQPSVPSSS